MAGLGSLRSFLNTKASAVARYIAISGVGNPVWTPRRYDLLAREAYTKNVIAYRCIDEVAKAVSQTPVLLYRRPKGGKRTLVEDHPVVDLLRRPNPTQSYSRWIYDVTSYLAIAGNSYIEGVGPDTGPNAGKFLELWTKHPDRMQVIPGSQGVMGYQHQINGNTTRWTVDPVSMTCGIKHIKLFHPLNDWYGMSPIEAAAYSIDTHNKTGEWNKALLDNSARPDGVMTTERQMNDTQFMRLKEQLNERYTGAKNAGRPMLLENGLTWQQMSFSPKDMDFLESKATSARDIANAFGVPPMLLAIPGDNTFSNQKEARMAFFDTTVVWYLQMIVDELSSWLLPAYDDPTLELDFDLDAVPAMALRREQLFERADAVSFLTPNEKRELTGYDPVDGGETLLVPTTMQTLEHCIEGPPQPEPTQGKPVQSPTKPAKKPASSKSLNSTLKATREELDLTQEQFAAWLEGEGLDAEKAQHLASLT